MAEYDALRSLTADIDGEGPRRKALPLYSCDLVESCVRLIEAGVRLDYARNDRGEDPIPLDPLADLLEQAVSVVSSEISRRKRSQSAPGRK